MPDSGTYYLIASVALLVASGLMSWISWRGRTDNPQQPLEGILLICVISSLVSGSLAIIGTLEFSPDARPWPRTLLQVVLSASIALLAGATWQRRTKDVSHHASTTS